MMQQKVFFQECSLREKLRNYAHSLSIYTVYHKNNQDKKITQNTQRTRTIRTLTNVPHCSSKQLDGFSEKEKNQNRDSPDKSAIINVFFDVWHLLLNYNLIISGQCTAQTKKICF